MTLRDLDEVLTSDNQEIVVGKWYNGDPFNPDNASEILWNGFVVDVLNCKYVDCEIKDLYIGRDGKFIVSLSEEDVDKFVEEEKVEKYGKRVKAMLAAGYTVPQVLGCIHGLFEDYEINEATETKLYEIADPRDEYNEPAEYWNKWNFDNYLELDTIPRTAESEMNRINGIANKARR